MTATKLEMLDDGCGVIESHQTKGNLMDGVAWEKNTVSDNNGDDDNKASEVDDGCSAFEKKKKTHTITLKRPVNSVGRLESCSFSPPPQRGPSY